MELNLQKEAFSRAYVAAVAAAAGYAVGSSRPDDKSIDLTIESRSTLGLVKAPILAVQLKSTAKRRTGGDEIVYELTNLRNYDDLRQPDVMVPRLLVVVYLPEDPEDWLEQDEERLSMRHCGYWLSLRGMPPTDNRSSVTLRLPRGQRFGVAELQEIMGRLDWGERP